MSAVLEGTVLAALREWLPGNAEADRPRVQLATVDGEGRPDLRTVLLSEWDEHGLVFHTDAASRKAAHLADRPQAAMLLLWPGFTRQLTARGTVVAQGAADAARAYADRSPYLQQLAWQNTAATARLPRAQRVDAWRQAEQVRAGGPLAPPSTWSGFVLQPDRVTFWEADAEGPSHRAEHRRDTDGAWSVHHLPG